MVFTLVLDGQSLTIAVLVEAARSEARISLHPDSLARIRRNREFAERVADRGDVVYGLSTGVGVRKKNRVANDLVRFNQRIIRETSTGQGPAIPADVTRATAIMLLNTMAGGRTMVRPELALRLEDRLSHGPPLRAIPTLGTTGIGDVVPLSHLASDLLGDHFLPAAGEALPLIAQSSLATASGALALHDTRRLIVELTQLAALDIEGFAANPSPYHWMAGVVRPYPGYMRALDAIGRALDGSALHTTEPRHLQAPLSFRCAAAVLGAADDALSFCEGQAGIEINAHQQNPLALHEEDTMLPVAHFDMQPLATALDVARLALAPCLTCQAERSCKLLQARESGLTDGLEPRSDGGGHGYSGLAFTLQAITAEAKLLIQPVSAEVGSASQAEGIEDRITMAGLAARKLAEMTTLGFRIAAISTLIASQAIHLRGGSHRLGPVLRDTLLRIRSIVPALSAGCPPPLDLEPLYSALRGGMLSGSGQGAGAAAVPGAAGPTPAGAAPTAAHSRL